MVLTPKRRAKWECARREADMDGRSLLEKDVLEALQQTREHGGSEEKEEDYVEILTYLLTGRWSIEEAEAPAVPPKKKIKRTHTAGDSPASANSDKSAVSSSSVQPSTGNASSSSRYLSAPKPPTATTSSPTETQKSSSDPSNFSYRSPTSLPSSSTSTGQLSLTLPKPPPTRSTCSAPDTSDFVEESSESDNDEPPQFEERRSRARKPVERYGNRQSWSAALDGVGKEGMGVELAKEIRGDVRQSYQLEKEARIRMADKGKKKQEKKEDKPEEPPTFLTPSPAAVVLRLGVEVPYKSSDPSSTLKKQNDSDVRLLRQAQRMVEEWTRRESDEVEVKPLAGDEAYAMVRTVEGVGRSRRSVMSDVAVEVYEEVEVQDVGIVRVSDVVLVAGGGTKSSTPWFGKVVYFHQAADGDESIVFAHLIWLIPATSKLGHAAHRRHLLVFGGDAEADGCDSVPASSIVRVLTCARGNEKTVEKGFFYNSLLLPDRNLVKAPADDASTPLCDKLGIASCPSCERIFEDEARSERDEQGDRIPVPFWVHCEEVPSFMLDSIVYHLNPEAPDVVYLLPPEEAQQKPHRSGATAPLLLARLLGVAKPPSSGEDTKAIQLGPTTLLVVQPLLRRGHLAQTSDYRDVVETSEHVEIPLCRLMGKARLEAGPVQPIPANADQEVFFLTGRLPHAKNETTRQSILSTWALPPRLLNPHATLSVDLLPLIQPRGENGDGARVCGICIRDVFKKNEELEREREATALGVKVPTGSLYSGLDLLGQGFEAGSSIIEVQHAVELDKDAAVACKSNKPKTTVWRSTVSRFLEKALAAKSDDPIRRPLKVTLFIAGPPCQAFSRANRQREENVKTDKRILEVFVCLSWVEVVKPLYFLIENVEGLTTFGVSVKGDVLGAVHDLACRMGYSVTTSIVDAGQMGCAARRSRLFLALSRHGLPVWTAPQPLHAVKAANRLAAYNYDQDGSHPVQQAVAGSSRGAALTGPFPAVPVGVALSVLETVKVGELVKMEMTNHVTSPLSAKEQASLKEDPDLRLQLDDLSTTLTTSDSLKKWSIHPTEDRFFSPAEKLILQGAPPDLILPSLRQPDELSKSSLATASRQIGNGVAVPVAAAFARTLPITSLVAANPLNLPLDANFFSALDTALEEDPTCLSSYLAGTAPPSYADIASSAAPSGESVYYDGGSRVLDVDSLIDGEGAAASPAAVKGKAASGKGRKKVSFAALPDKDARSGGGDGDEEDVQMGEATFDFTFPTRGHGGGKWGGGEADLSDGGSSDTIVADSQEEDDEL